jgi:selT/selW/selH-like putative selenoprotein
LAAAIESEFGIKSELIKAAGGRFEVTADGKLVFSKLKQDRFPENAEVLAELSKLSANH